MKRNLIHVMTAGMLLMMSVPAYAQAVKVKAEDGEFKVRAPGVKVEGRLGEKATTGHFSRASKIIGVEVKNSEGTSLGTINDLMLDERGNVHYFVMTHGGVLGVGQKYCAVPFKAATIKHKADADSHFVELNVSPKTLEKARTFTSDKWPDFRDPVFVKETDTFFGDSVKIRTDRK